jgi:hypothetical protein
MNLGGGFRKFIGYISPAFYASRVTFPAYKSTIFLILVLTGIASALQAAGVGLIYFLILIFTNKQPDSLSGIAILDEILSSPAIVTIGCVLLLTSGVKLKQAMIMKTMSVSALSGKMAGKLSLAHAKRLIKNDDATPPEDKNFRSVISSLIKDMPFASGFAARGFSMIAINVVQATVLFSIMFYLSPFLTMSVLLVSTVFIGFLSISYENVLGVTEQRAESMPRYKEEIDELSSGLLDPGTNESEFSTQVDEAFSRGGASEQLRLRIALRSERATGSLVMEYIYPVALIGILLLYTYSDSLALDISKVAVYFLLLRQAVTSLYAVGGAFISFSKQHQPLVALVELLEHDKLPGLPPDLLVDDE